MRIAAQPSLEPNPSPAPRRAPSTNPVGIAPLPSPHPRPVDTPSTDSVGIAPLPTPHPRPVDARDSLTATSGAQKGISGDPDRPNFQTSDFSNGAIFVKIPGIIDVGDLPDGVSANIDILA